MAKAIISSILEAQLGKYVDGLGGDSLQLGLWSGELVLQNLSLKPHALAELELPVAVVRGSVRRVHVVVPWNHLGSASVRVSLEGVHALVAPNAQLPSRAELRQAKAAAVARHELRRRHDRFAAARNGAADGGADDARRVDESTFLSRLTERIVDNLQVTLRDVHFRYEDSASNPAAPFACGVMIESFAFQTTDAEGREVFLDRSAQRAAPPFVHKRANVAQLAVYWDRLVPGSSQLLQHQHDAERRMEDMVRAMATHPNHHQWLLRPCSLAVQLTKNESQSYAHAAKFTVQAALSDIALGLAREQYEDLLFVRQAFLGRRAIEAHFLQGRCRPFHDAHASPREWWDYATRLALAARRAKAKTGAVGTGTSARTKRNVRLRWSTVQRAGAERRLYMEAFRMQLRKGGGALDPASKHARVMETYEMTYPVDVVMAARDAAEDEEEKKRREDSASHASKAGSASGGSWYDYFFGGAATAETRKSDTAGNDEEASSADELENVLSAQGRADLKQAYDEVTTKQQTQSVPPGCNLVSIKLQLKSGSLSLFQSAHGSEPFFVGRADGSLALNLQPSDEWDAKFRLQRFEILNGRAAKDSAFRTFCSLSSAAKASSPKLPCVSFDASLRNDSLSSAGAGVSKNSTLTIRVSAVPIQVMVDPSFVVLVQDFFQSMLPDHQLERVWSFATSSVSDWIFSDQEDEMLATTLQSGRATTRYDVEVDMRAPVFVVPEDVSDARSSVVVVDLGQISFTSDPADQSQLLEQEGGGGAFSSKPATLRWRLDVKNLQILLGRLHNLDWVADAEFRRFAKLVQELNLEFGVETLAPSLELRPSKERAAAANLYPNTSVQATIPQITVALAEDQLIALARIHSSILAQMTLAGSGGPQQQEPPHDSSSIQAATPSTDTPQLPSDSANASTAAAETPDKYHLQAQVSLGEIVVNLRESATRDAFRLRVTQTSFDLGMFSSQYVLQARLQSLLMEDLLYPSSSCFRQLMSTGATEETHLVSVDVTMYPSSPPSSSMRSFGGGSNDAVKREATFMVVDMKFNVLDVQWNPSSMSLIYRIASSYAVALQHHSIGLDMIEASGAETEGPSGSVLATDEPPSVARGYTISGTTETHAQHSAGAGGRNFQPQSPSTASSQPPSIVARASLVQFSVTFNKDDLNRQLVKLAMKDASLEFSSKDVSITQTHQQTSAAYEWKGYLGNFIATDLSMMKHPVYSPLVGLDESASSAASAGTQKKKARRSALLAFTFSFDPTTSDKSVMSLQFQPVRMVYYHQQVLELADYLFEGILGTMVSQTLLSATQMLLSEAEASVVLQVSFEKPTVVLPVRMEDPDHVRITAELVSLRHFPTSAVHFFGAGSLEKRRRVVAPGEELASSVVRRSDCLSLRLDYKQVTLKSVNIVCVSEIPSSSGGDSSPGIQQSVVARPLDLVVDVEDLVSSDVRFGDGPFLSRFLIKVSMAELVLLVQRRNYLLFVGLLMDNFGAEQLQVASPSASAIAPDAIAAASADESSASGRPNVSYTYSRTDLEAVTMELGFLMKSVRCVLYEEDTHVSEAGQPQRNAGGDRIASEALDAFARPGETAMSEIVASDFGMSLNFLRDASPSIAVCVTSFCVRELTHGAAVDDSVGTAVSSGDNSSSSASPIDSESQGVLLVCTEPTQASYSWDEEKLTCELELNLSSATGVLIPEAVWGLVDFFTIPPEAEHKSPPRLLTATASQQALSRSESGGSQHVRRRKSITEFGRDASGGVAYAMTVRLSATKLAIDVPQDLSDVESPRISLGADLSAEYKWKPVSANAQDDKSADFDIQSSVVVDARAIEVVVKNANRQGCHVASSSDGSHRVEIATLVQLLEPCDLHMEVSDLFPHAGQQQQIVAFRFTPIEIFVSYDDGCVGAETLHTLSESMARYERKKQRQQSEAERVAKAKHTGGVLSPKTFASSRSVGGAGAENLEIHRYFTCEVSSMRLTVINDCDGCDMGLLQVQMQRCNAFMNVTYAPTPLAGASFPPPSTVISGGGGFMMMMAYYNPDTRTWHQMCREWGLDISLQGSIYNDGLQTGSAHAQPPRGSDNELHIIVTANQPLDLLVTHGLLEVAASAGGAWNRRAQGAAIANSPLPSPVALSAAAGSREAREKKKHAPCVISNETGLPVRFWLTNGQSTTQKEVVWSGEIADLHYVHTIGRGSGVVRKYASSDREDNMRLCVELVDSAFQPVHGIIFEQLGSRAFSLVDASGSLSQFTLNCHAKLVDGRILLALSSQMKLVNNLSMPVQLLVNDPAWRAPVDIGVLYPCRESAIPVLLSLGTELRVRPIDDAFSWSAPIPVQTWSAIAQKVEAASNGAGDVHSAVFCVAMTVEQSLRVVCLSEPIVVVNKLPVELEYSVKSPLLTRTHSSTCMKTNTLGVGAKGGIWWTDSAQRPQFQLRVKGCRPSKWIELVHPGSKSGDVFSVMLERRDGRAFKLLIQVVEEAAKSMHVFLYAEVWFVNRTGLELTYGNELELETYIPPMDARALVGNAQICAFSSGSEASSGPPIVRIRMGSCRWSSRFVADPRKLSWQDECLSLRSERRADDGTSMLYEFGVSADYSTRHFGSITTLVSVIPRYLVLNRTPHTVLLLEDSVHGSSSATEGNAAHHILARGDAYALYWVTGARSKLHVSVIGEHSDYGWSKAISVDHVASSDVVLPAVAHSARPIESRQLTLQVSVKRGSISQATFVVEINEAPAGDASSPATQSPAGAAVAAHAGWDTFSVHTQIAGVIVTVADKKESDGDGGGARSAEKAKATASRAAAGQGHFSSMGGAAEDTNENVARLTISRISLESNVSPQGTSAKMNVMGVKVEDLLANSKNPVVLRPVFRKSAAYDHPYRSGGGGGSEKYFLEVAYMEKPHAKYTWVEKLHVELQDVKITTSMRFVDRLNALMKETISHFQSRSLSLSSRTASSLLEEKESSDENILEYFTASVASAESEGDTSMASLTGQKMYVENCEIAPVRVVVSFSREKGDVRGADARTQGFWLANLKFKIENACLTLDAYRITHAMATQEALLESLAAFYVKSVKSQALGLIDSIQVTSLVTSMVTGGVSSIVNTLIGKTDPSLAAAASHFQYHFQSNTQIVDKHSRLFAQCRSSTEFVEQIRHLVFDWDSNHKGLEARGCVALGILNNSRHSLVVNARLNDGAELRVLPLGRRSLASVADEHVTPLGRNEWRADRSLVVFAWGYTPTLLTSGDVYFTVHSNACNVFVTRKTARLKANPGYTATFTHQETQSWWATNVVIVGDDIQARTPGIASSAHRPSVDAARLSSSSTAVESSGAAPGHDLFGSNALVPTAMASSAAQDEYEVTFSSASLGIIAKQSGRAVIVRELCALPSGAPGPALATGQITPGDSILTVAGMTVTNTTQFAQLVSQSPRPVVLRFRRTSAQASVYNLFGEAPRPSRSRETSGAASVGSVGDDDDGFDLFGGK